MSFDMPSTQWTTRPRLPLELVDLVIDHLYDNPLDLRSCALVCRAWLPSCRFHIFRQIDIQLYNPPNGSFLGLSRLYEAIQRSPDIGFYVQELFFSVTRMDSLKWSHQEAELPPLLNSFTSLKVFELEGIIWSDLTPPIRKAFRGVFALPSIIDVSLINVDFGKVEHFTDLIHTPLKRLHLNIDFQPGHAEVMQAIDEENEGLQSPGRRPCRLEYLGLTFLGPDFADWLLGEQTIIDLSAIHTFDTCDDPDEAENTSLRIMRRVGLSLNHFILRDPPVEDWDGSIEDTVDLSCIPNIEALDFLCETHPHLPHYLAMCLSRLPAGKLREITIFAVDNSVECLWSELDDLLNSQPFETLQRVNLYAWPYDQRILAQFPSLGSRGILHFL